MEELQDKSYLGDGVYVGHDGYQYWLYTLEGNRIALEPVALTALNAYAKRIRDTASPKEREGVSSE